MYKEWIAVVLVGLAMSSLAGPCHGQLKVGFYNGKCGKVDVEKTIEDIVTKKHAKDPTVTPALLRMQFHDCFVRGCDASLLLEGAGAEKEAGPNRSLRGFDLIEELKEALENACPGVVSCSDIIVLATRDAVSASGGKRYEVPTGRRDGRISTTTDVDLLGPNSPAVSVLEAFKKKGFTAQDMVVLLGAHTVGVTHCGFIQSRLYNFNGTGQADPSMDTQLAFELRKQCPEDKNVFGIVQLDQNPKNSVNDLDQDYFKQLISRRGILFLDQDMALDPSTRDIVKSLAAGSDFADLFAKAMVKMSSIDVLTGTQGEIRKVCAAKN